MLGKKADYDSSDVGRDETLGVHFDVLAILERHNDTGVCRRPADTVLFKRFYQARLGEARWRLRKVLFRPQFIKLYSVARCNLRQ